MQTSLYYILYIISYQPIINHFFFQIWRINTKYNLLYIKGYNIPGPNHCYVRIMDSTLNHRYRQRAKDPPSMPTFYPDEQDEPLPEELFMEDIHQFTDPTVTYEEDGKTG